MFIAGAEFSDEMLTITVNANVAVRGSEIILTSDNKQL